MIYIYIYTQYIYIDIIETDVSGIGGMTTAAPWMEILDMFLLCHSQELNNSGRKERNGRT